MCRYQTKAREYDYELGTDIKLFCVFEEIFSSVD